MECVLYQLCVSVLRGIICSELSQSATLCFKDASDVLIEGDVACFSVFLYFWCSGICSDCSSVYEFHALLDMCKCEVLGVSMWVVYLIILLFIWMGGML